MPTREPQEIRRDIERTREELARTYPGGVIPEDLDAAAAHEGSRRPGTD